MARYPLSTFGGWPGDPFVMLHREMNRLFDEVGRGSALSGTTEREGGTMLAPHMDVTETDNEIRIQAELPGVAEKDITVDLSDDLLTIRAEKRREQPQERHGVHFTERSYGTFQRAIRVPFRVDPEQVKAQFENGVLTIRLPKTQQEQRSRRISVQAAQQSSGSDAEANARTSLPGNSNGGHAAAGGSPAGSDAQTSEATAAGNASA